MSSTEIIAEIRNAGGAVIDLWRREDRRGLTHHEIVSGRHITYGWDCRGCLQGAEMTRGLPETAQLEVRRDAEAHASVCSGRGPGAPGAVQD
ncbi:hypothetical protein [Streptomyces triculaminicus]|uniref:hypothetical protein n=1 Tax=Streptomyces triculaminicus TaxID=2816232 RepID=UPI0037B0E3FD